jgi:hypothetical protein
MKEDNLRQVAAVVTDAGYASAAGRPHGTLYSYKYDSNGNWTVKRSNSIALPDGHPRDLTEVHRSLEYY